MERRSRGKANEAGFLGFAAGGAAKVEVAGAMIALAPWSMSCTATLAVVAGSLYNPGDQLDCSQDAAFLVDLIYGELGALQAGSSSGAWIRSGTAQRRS